MTKYDKYSEVFQEVEIETACKKHGVHNDYFIKGNSSDPKDYCILLDNKGAETRYYKHCYCMKCIDDLIDSGLLMPMVVRKVE